MTGTDLCVNKPVTVPVIFEPPCNNSTKNARKPIINSFTHNVLLHVSANHVAILRTKYKE